MGSEAFHLQDEGGLFSLADDDHVEGAGLASFRELNLLRQSQDRLPSFRKCFSVQRVDEVSLPEAACPGGAVFFQGGDLEDLSAAAVVDDFPLATEAAQGGVVIAPVGGAALS